MNVHAACKKENISTTFELPSFSSVGKPFSGDLEG